MAIIRNNLHPNFIKKRRIETISKQLVAYAGIDPRVYQSVIISGEHLSITKKGNKHLRTLLYLAVQGSIKSRNKNIIIDFYEKKDSKLTLLVTKLP